MSKSRAVGVGILLPFILALMATPAKASHVEPELSATTNPMCDDFGLLELVRFDPPADDSENGVTIDVHGSQTFDWTSTIGIDLVIVKGGSNGNLYAYDEETADTGLHAPDNTNGSFFGLSHISFCYDITPEITVTKACTPSGQIGDIVEYTITIENTGEDVLEGITVDDSLIGDLSGDFPNTLDVGESHQEVYQREITADDPDPVVNEVTATATGVETGTEVSDDDSCRSDVVHVPGIEVSKECTGPAVVGDEVSYTITVTNTGDDVLEGVTVDDSLLGDISDEFPDALGVGDSAQAVVTRAVQADDPDVLENVVTASATGADSDQAVEDTASCETDILRPAITVTKECTPSAGIGDSVTYTITVKNTGNETLEGITVSDSLLGDISASFPDTLDPGEEHTEEISRTVLETDPDPVVNEVDVSAVGVDSGIEVTSDDACESDVTHEPGLEVSKACTGPANVGDLVTYTITVENTGNEPLTGLTVDDSLLGDISAEFPDGLDVGETVSVEVTRIVLPGDPDVLENTVTASATGADSQESVSDDASCDSAILRPAIDISKTGPALAHVGDEVTYEMTVTNIGNTPLLNVTVSDPLCDSTPVFTGGDVDSDGLLALTETWTYTCVHVISAEDGDPVPNTATAAGEDDLGTPVSAEDDHVVDIIHPAIGIAKTSDTAVAGPDQEVTFTLVVTNEGDTPLHDVVVSDPLCGSVEFVGGDTNTDGILDLTEAWTFTCSAVLFEPVPPGTIVSPVTNTATASGTDVLGETVTDEDAVSVLPVLAEPPLENPPAPEGEPPAPRPRIEILPRTGTDGLQQTARLGVLFLALGLALGLATRRRLSPLTALALADGPASRLVASQATTVAGRWRTSLPRLRARRRGLTAAPGDPGP